MLWPHGLRRGGSWRHRGARRGYFEGATERTKVEGRGSAPPRRPRGVPCSSRARRGFRFARFRRLARSNEMDRWEKRRRRGVRAGQRISCPPAPRGRSYRSREGAANDSALGALSGRRLALIGTHNLRQELSHRRHGSRRTSANSRTGLLGRQGPRQHSKRAAAPLPAPQRSPADSRANSHGAPTHARRSGPGRSQSTRPRAAAAARRGATAAARARVPAPQHAGEGGGHRGREAHRKGRGARRRVDDRVGRREDARGRGPGVRSKRGGGPATATDAVPRLRAPPPPTTIERKTSVAGAHGLRRGGSRRRRGARRG